MVCTNFNDYTAEIGIIIEIVRTGAMEITYAKLRMIATCKLTRLLMMDGSCTWANITPSNQHDQKKSHRYILAKITDSAYGTWKTRLNRHLQAKVRLINFHCEPINRIHQSDMTVGLWKITPLASVFFGDIFAKKA